MSVKAIFDHALELPAGAARQAYLDKVCGHGSPDRQKVEALLQAHDEAGSFLYKPIAQLKETVDSQPGQDEGAQGGQSDYSETMASPIGPYKLLEKIGEGGFGVVFMAEQQEPIRRKVALKILKPGMDSKQIIARFEAERQALALMDHPNIARVLDAGTIGSEPSAEPRTIVSGPEEPLTIVRGSVRGSGRPYFVMELVRGPSITEYCDQHNLPVRERLDLFVDVCQAVQHAHHKGIIHRDIKPSNVLITLHDGKPVVKVIDFGIAKAVGQQLTDKTLFTGFAELIGTPLYMSPEQAELSGLDVDTRSDIYSLGVLLYELLTGTTPFDKARLREVGFDELRRVIREEEPVKPSTRISTLGQAASTVSANRQSEPRRLSQLFRGELDWIVMKALEKDRNRRYETASAFAADIERYLDDQPVLACPPGLGYRLGKFVRRHKGKATAAAAIMVSFLAATAISTWQAVRATSAEQKTSQALAQVTAEQQKTQAALTAETAAKAQTREALDALTNEVVQTMFARQPELGEPEKAFLQKVLGSYQAVSRQMGDTAEARFLQAKGIFQVAFLRKLVGQEITAEADYRQAAGLLAQLADDFPDVAEYRDKLAASHNNRGVILADLGSPQEARAAFRLAVALREPLVKRFPKVLFYRRELAASYNDLASILKRQKHYAEAEKIYSQALDVMENLVAEAGTVPEYHQGLARIRSNRGALLREQGKLPEAEEVYRQVLKVQEAQLTRFSTVARVRRELADSYHGLGIVCTELSKADQADAAFQKAVDLRKKLLYEYPNVLQYRRDLADLYSDQGHFLMRQRIWAEAEEAYGHALDLRKKVAAKAGAARDRQQLANSHEDLAKLWWSTDRLKDAESACLDALPIREQLAGESRKVPDYQNELAGTLGKLAVLHNQRREFADALALLERARPRHLAALKAGPTDSRYRLCYRNNLQALATSHLGLGDHTRLATTAEDLARLDYEPATDNYLAARMLCSCATLTVKDAQLSETGQADLARRYADRALTLLKQAVAHGFKDAENMKTAGDLEPLRTREEFRKLLADLEGKTKE
jgi:serine/threonine protein kinase/tetratricopeptide (TPR) repeat protein